jgi:hypothetical protein
MNLVLSFLAAIHSFIHSLPSSEHLPYVGLCLGTKSWQFQYLL